MLTENNEQNKWEERGLTNKFDNRLIQRQQINNKND